MARALLPRPAEVAVGHHDEAFRALMNEPGALEALLRERLPRALVERFAGAPERMSESFIDETMGTHFADVVARVPLDGGDEAVAFCLIEHKRLDEPFALVQLLRYMTNLYARAVNDAKDGKLPPVFGLLVYNGTATWAGPTQFADLVNVEAELRSEVLNFPVVLLDLGATATASVAEHPTLSAGLLALKAAAGKAYAEKKEVGVEALRLLEGDALSTALFLRYVLHVGDKELERALRSAEREVCGEERRMQTAAEGYLKQGRKEGREEGREEGLRTALRGILTKRFKRLPARVKAELASADAATLQRLLDAAIDAPTLDVVFPGR